MAHFLIDNNCAIQGEMVVELELALIEKKQSRRFRHKSIIKTMQESYERVRKYCSRLLKVRSFSIPVVPPGD